MKKLAPFLFAFVSSIGIVVASQAYAATNTSMCYDLYQPVCAAKPVECFAAPCYPVYTTYSNSCFMQADNATIIHEGVCTDSETGSFHAGAPVVTAPPPTPAPYTPPAGCIAWFDGCNSCGVAGTNGGSICTEMACVGATKPGYCTAYAATSTPPVVKPVSPAHPVTPIVTGSVSATTSVDVSASTTATSTASHSVASFFSRLWHTIIGWFGFH